MDGTIRNATTEDADLIVDLIAELAEYEKLSHEAVATPELILEHIFGDNPAAHVLIIETPEGEAAGMSLWFRTFSTFLGQPGIWLEDLFVTPERRGLGLGRMLLETLAQVCVERGYPRFEWWVLDWNTPAHGFYRSLGAVPQDEWTVWRTDGEALATLGRR